MDRNNFLLRANRIMKYFFINIALVGVLQLISCGPSAEEKKIADENTRVEKFIGEWENIAPKGNCGARCPTYLKIYKDGDLFLLDVVGWSDGGRDYGLVQQGSRLPLIKRDGYLVNNDGSLITYGEDSDHLYYDRQEFKRK